MRHNENIIVKNLTLAETIAHRNPEMANELLIKNGYPASRDQAELARRLNAFLLNKREHALKELANIHPDKALLISNFSGDDNADGNDDGHMDQGKHKGLKKHPGRHHHHNADGNYHNCCGYHGADGYSNCAGCGGSCKAKNYHNADGGASKPSSAGSSQMPALMNTQMLAIVGIIALASIALISLNRSKA